MDIIVILLGLALGSFYNVLGYRLPRRESVIQPPSHCPQCGHRLGAFDLVPVLSYVWLQGRCRYCSSPVSARYPLVEATTGMLFWLAYRAFGLAPGTPLAWLLVSLLVVGLLITLEARRRGRQHHRAHTRGLAAKVAKDEAGVTLIEVLAALVLLGLVVTATLGLYGEGARSQKQSASLSEATALSQSVLEGVRHVASEGALPPLPPELAEVSVQREGVTYLIRLGLEPDAEVPTLTRATVSVEWDLPQPGSLDMATLVAASSAKGGGGHGKSSEAWRWLELLAQ